MASRRQGRTDGQRARSRSGTGDRALPPFRVAAGLGDADRERMLLSALSGSGDIVIAERCLSADQLVASVQRGSIDAILVASDLHRLSNERIEDLIRSVLPLVLLVPDPDDERWHDLPGAVLPSNADAATVQGALGAVIRGERPALSRRRDELAAPDIEPGIAPDTAEQSLPVIALVSGYGSPGRTTVAVSLAAALGAVAPTILVDADLSGPAVAACLDADPTRNISMLVHADPETARDWDRAFAQETQPLHPRSPHGVVLCGVPKPEMRSGITVRFFERVIAELRQRYRYVILDVGADLIGTEMSVHRAALAESQQVLLVTSGDLVGLWRARAALSLIENQLAVSQEHVALLINRHDHRHHHARSEIEWALAQPAAAVVPYDHRSVERATAAQHPVVFERSSAGRTLFDLAERIHGGRILLPQEVAAKRRRWKLPGFPGTSRFRRPKFEEGVGDGDYVTPVS